MLKYEELALVHYCFVLYTICLLPLYLSQAENVWNEIILKSDYSEKYCEICFRSNSTILTIIRLPSNNPRKLWYSEK